MYLPAFEAVVPPLLERVQARRHRGPARHRRPPHRPPDPPRPRHAGLRQAFTRLLPLAPKIVALGGGGYDVRNVAKAWTIAWSILNNVELPARASRVVRARHQATQLRIPPTVGPTRPQSPKTSAAPSKTTSTARSTPSKRRSSPSTVSRSVRTGRRSRISSSRPGLRGGGRGRVWGPWTRSRPLLPCAPREVEPSQGRSNTTCRLVVPRTPHPAPAAPSQPE